MSAAPRPVASEEKSRRVNSCLQVDLGLIPYAEAHALQKRIVAARKLGAIGDVLLFCEHPHVITQGRNGKREHLLASESVLRQKGVEFFETSRGGDVTYHGPGQTVAYPILNLGAIRRDVVWYVRQLEEAMIRATAEFGIAAGREAGKTGVWVGEGKTGCGLQGERAIENVNCAVGEISRVEEISRAVVGERQSCINVSRLARSGDRCDRTGSRSVWVPPRDVSGYRGK